MNYGNLVKKLFSKFTFKTKFPFFVIENLSIFEKKLLPVNENEPEFLSIFFANFNKDTLETPKE